jgi:hypothetical protein
MLHHSGWHACSQEDYNWQMQYAALQWMAQVSTKDKTMLNVVRCITVDGTVAHIMSIVPCGACANIGQYDMIMIKLNTVRSTAVCHNLARIGLQHHAFVESTPRAVPQATQWPVGANLGRPRQQ